LKTNHVRTRKVGLYEKKKGEMIMTERDLNQVKSDKVVDCRGSACPGPLLEAKKGIGGVPVGGVLEIWSSDPGTKADIPAWARKVGHEFIGVLAGEGYDRVFVIRKK
jgi:tRNA 2-thiouridine synthesizing protein A